MKTKAYRGLDKLTPSFKEKVEKFLAEVNKDSKVIFVTETWRSEERQKELVKLGYSWVSHSNHQDGLAIDIAFFSSLYPSDFSLWRKVADIGKKYGIDWGYDLWKTDKPHMQDNGLPLLPLTQKPTMSKYTEIMNTELKNANISPLFTSHYGDGNLTEQEIKELIEIALTRFYTKYIKK